MNTMSCDTSLNWSEVVPYVILDSEQIVKQILCAKRCFFYDACSFRNHALIKHSEHIFTHIKKQEGVIILTKMIVMELCSNDHKLWKEHIEYIIQMHQMGISVLYVAEETIFEVLYACYNGIAQVNRMFASAVKYTRNVTGAIERTLQESAALRKEIFSNADNKDRRLAQRFFETMRQNKIPGDNMGEELLAVCLHMLANIQEAQRYKYIVLTDDYAAITLLGRVKENVEKYIGGHCISGVTTAKLCWMMVQEGIVSTKEEVYEMMCAGRCDTQLRVYSSEQYELRPSEKMMSIEEFARKVVDDIGMKVYV